MILRNKRERRGCIDFDFDESKLVCDESGKVIDVKKYERRVSNKIIEEFMLAANETIAENYLDISPGVKLIFGLWAGLTPGCSLEVYESAPVWVSVFPNKAQSRTTKKPALHWYCRTGLWKLMIWHQQRAARMAAASFSADLNASLSTNKVSAFAMPLKSTRLWIESDGMEECFEAAVFPGFLNLLFVICFTSFLDKIFTDRFPPRFWYGFWPP